MTENRYLPNTDQISVIAATILLTFAISGFLSIPEQQIRFELWNIYLVLSLNAQTMVMIVASILAATGSDWLIRNHPLWNKRSTVEHWVLPLLTALVLGFLISRLEGSLYGWISFFLGAGFLMGILIAEYITVNPHDLRYPIAITVLIAISYVLFLLFCILIRLLNYRLIFTLPSLFFASMLVSLRSLRLRRPQRWMLPEATLIALISIQIASSLHYWPISPLSFGLAILGVNYALFLLIHHLHSNPTFKLVYLEPLFFLIISWILAYWLK
ncbi:MAG: hypothetical protein DDG59_10735 [Anaerolineae bacterium]|nr:MAG: hypothetical protein DDG59_10735 [Anaerolineae bacterium]